MTSAAVTAGDRPCTRAEGDGEEETILASSFSSGLGRIGGPSSSTETQPVATSTPLERSCEILSDSLFAEDSDKDLALAKAESLLSDTDSLWDEASLVTPDSKSETSGDNYVIYRMHYETAELSETEQAYGSSGAQEAFDSGWAAERDEEDEDWMAVRGASTRRVPYAEDSALVAHPSRWRRRRQSSSLVSALLRWVFRLP